VQVPGSLSEAEVYESRERICDIGLLRESYRDSDGSLRWRCPAEPEEAYLRKGGKATALPHRQCLCNGLLATIGLGQIRKGGTQEPPLLTAGDDLSKLDIFLENGLSYSARDVIEKLLPGTPAPLPAGG